LTPHHLCQQYFGKIVYDGCSSFLFGSSWRFTSSWRGDLHHHFEKNVLQHRESFGVCMF